MLRFLTDDFYISFWLGLLISIFFSIPILYFVSFCLIYWTFKSILLRYFWILFLIFILTFDNRFIFSQKVSSSYSVFEWSELSFLKSFFAICVIEYFQMFLLVCFYYTLIMLYICRKLFQWLCFYKDFKYDFLLVLVDFSDKPYLEFLQMTIIVVASLALISFCFDAVVSLILNIIYV